MHPSSPSRPHYSSPSSLPFRSQAIFTRFHAHFQDFPVSFGNIHCLYKQEKCSVQSNPSETHDRLKTDLQTSFTHCSTSPGASYSHNSQSLEVVWWLAIAIKGKIRSINFCCANSLLKQKACLSLLEQRLRLLLLSCHSSSQCRVIYNQMSYIGKYQIIKEAMHKHEYGYHGLNGKILPIYYSCILQFL